MGKYNFSKSDTNFSFDFINKKNEHIVTTNTKIAAEELLFNFSNPPQPKFNEKISLYHKLVNNLVNNTLQDIKRTTNILINKLYFCYINNIYFKLPNPSKKFEENVYKLFSKIPLTHQEINILENINTYINYPSITKNKNFNFFEKYKNIDSNILNREIEFYELNNVLKKYI